MNTILFVSCWIMLSAPLAILVGRSIKYQRDGTLKSIKIDDDEQWEYFNGKNVE